MLQCAGEPEKQLNETINYNEHFSWEWRQGRLGFGPFGENNLVLLNHSLAEYFFSLIHLFRMETRFQFEKKSKKKKAMLFLLKSSV